ncbi:helix-turn-helix transcriptional regulator [Paenibacillus chitinolyticus]|uniref:helix-turn-helix domain-containing protein n=1 Tax=Paenibacillus chitinolyticus TaxID=79263 RepID=UPI002DC00805|nr:helix-turn-helix transcriptional regulator [Paenibacillus chitinolyticus]MEC0248877.1 helix-turn-helix transcriptional regulator [Paenibacillus chitinolyticus]
MTIGERIKDLRTKKNLGQEELAKLLGIQRSAVSQYETDRNVPPTNIVIKLSEIFNVSTDYILAVSPDKDSNLNGLTDEEKEMFKRFVYEAERLFREKGVTEDKMRQVMGFMRFTFLSDLEEEKKGINSK